ncbi:MAG: thiolase family protein [Pigmentiphaga sp.]|nr:thiolase family protein [Pigmentiphaga sp.]
MTHKANDVYVIGLGLHPATLREDGLRLEEMVYQTCRRALDHAGVSRAQLDNVVLGASDELDGRPITNMLLSAPAGGYLKDEIRVTDSGANALCMGFARIRTGEFDLGLVGSWCKGSKIDSETVMNLRADPFYYRPLGMGTRVANGLLAQAVMQHGVDENEVNRRVLAAYERARSNPRGLRRAVPPLGDLQDAPYEAAPLRQGQSAARTDGAVALILASGRFLNANRGCRPLARMAGAGWASDSYALGARRLGDFNSARTAWNKALAMSDRTSAADFDVIELESPTGWHEAAWVRVFGISDENVVSPSGGVFAQNPEFCSGLINAAEAVLQVAGQAGAVQRPVVRAAAAHSCHGFAQQGNVVVMFDRGGL